MKKCNFIITATLVLLFFNIVNAIHKKGDIYSLLETKKDKVFLKHIFKHSDYASLNVFLCRHRHKNYNFLNKLDEKFKTTKPSCYSEHLVFKEKNIERSYSYIFNGITLGIFGFIAKGMFYGEFTNNDTKWFMIFAGIAVIASDSKTILSNITTISERRKEMQEVITRYKSKKLNSYHSLIRKKS